MHSKTGYNKLVTVYPQLWKENPNHKKNVHIQASIKEGKGKKKKPWTHPTALNRQLLSDGITLRTTALSSPMDEHLWKKPCKSTHELATSGMRSSHFWLPLTVQ